ncbi:MAG: hypothetical protein AAGG48_09760 [Planctomycetota bacterium]
MKSPAVTSDRLSILHLMLLTAGISIALVVARCIEHVRFTADAHYYNLERVVELDLFGVLVASIYGLSVTLLVFAVGSKDFWVNPGKTLALLFASMCILNWGLELFAATVTHFRLTTTTQATGVADNRGYIWGIWYRSLAVDVGYVVCLPILLWVIYKTREQPLLWRTTWIAFLVFALLIIGQVHFGLTGYVTAFFANWYFEAAIGLPIFQMAAAAIRSASKGEINWWTTVTALAIAAAWCAGVANKLIA